MDAWKAGFAGIHSGVTVQYSPDGSGAGREAFLAGAVDFAGSDSYMTEEEIAQAAEVCSSEEIVEVPAYISPIAVAYNLPGVGELKLDAETMAKIFAGEITNWNEDAIAKQNPDADLPDLDITPVNRSDDSGTTENFTDYLHENVPDVWTTEADGNWPADLRGENAKGTSGVVSVVTDTPGAITYADASAVNDELGTVQVKVGEEYVELSSESAAAAVEAATPVEGRGESDMALELDRTTTESGAYPIVLISYQIYCGEYEDETTAGLVKAFGKYVVSKQGQQDASESAGSAPLSPALREQATAAIDSISAAG